MLTHESAVLTCEVHQLQCRNLQLDFLDFPSGCLSSHPREFLCDSAHWGRTTWSFPSQSDRTETESWMREKCLQEISGSFLVCWTPVLSVVLDFKGFERFSQSDGKGKRKGERRLLCWRRVGLFKSVWKRNQTYLLSSTSQTYFTSAVVSRGGQLSSDVHDEE